MATVITMPRLSDTMTQGTLTKWYKQAGETIQEGDVLADIETDKAIQEFESEESGVLLYQGVAQGETVAIDALIAIIGESGEDITSILSENSKKIEETPKSVPTIETSMVIEKTTTEPTSSESNERIKASPLAKKLAKEQHIDLSRIHGSGDGGRIMKKDIGVSTPSKITKSLEENLLLDTIIPITSMRAVIADRLTESKQSIPHYYLQVECMAEALIQAKNTLSTSESKISYNDLIMMATTKALLKHPYLNASWQADGIHLHGAVHLGFAVAIDEGLLVPVVKNAQNLSLNALANQIGTLAEEAKTRKISAQNMTGSTFTVSNLGMFGIDTFTSIINQPNVAILSVGAIIEQPIVKDAQLVAGHTLKLSLACDHRVVDGAKGSAFLKTLKSMIEQPLLMLG